MAASDKLQHHVTFCAQKSDELAQRSRLEELEAVQFLVENLSPRRVGDYRILVNCNIPMQSAASLEIDIVVINRFGVFLIDVKRWESQIDVYDDGWILYGKYRLENPLESINHKASVLYSRIFDEEGSLTELRHVNVMGLVVLTQGLSRFTNHSSKDSSAVVGLDSQLIGVITSTKRFLRNKGRRELDNQDIQHIRDVIYRTYRTTTTSHIAASLQQMLSQAGPHQAEVLRRCAIPRWFDRDVLVVLRERENGNQRVLELLRNYSFVRELGEGRYAYHDAVRDTLLKQWREQRPEDLRAINLRLADHFDKRVTTPASQPEQAPATAPLPDKQRNWTHEALYHRLMADPSAGMLQLEATFAQAEAVYDLGEAEALLEIASDAASDRNAELPFETLWERLERISQRPALRTDTPSTVSEVRGSETQDEIPPSAARAHPARAPSSKEPVKAQPEDEGYELFRRAIVGRDEEAWAAIHVRYRPLLVTWANQAIASLHIDESADNIADQALARAWVALTSERFAAFPTLVRLLSYLRACVTTTAVDTVRARAASERAPYGSSAITTATLEQIVLADPDRSALWRAVLAQISTPAERTLLVESVAFGFPPRTILARHPQLFANVAELYSVKRNLFARLQRNLDMQQLREELQFTESDSDLQ
jgi:hypothetical protein